MTHQRLAQHELMTAGEVADIFRVNPKTIGRWAKAGRLGYIQTPGGHKRYRREEVMQLLQVEGPADAPEE